jgi:hypothetical protein
MVSSVDGLAGVPLQLVRQVPPQRREVASETPDEQESQPPLPVWAFSRLVEVQESGCSCGEA